LSQEEKERIVIPDENGEEHLFEILFTFDVETTNNSYMVLTPVGEEEEEVEVFAFRYEEQGDGDGEDDLALFPIETEAEWEIVEEMLNTFEDDEPESE
jgi:uncharacterized protein YrzB (UPF0473 family)